MDFSITRFKMDFKISRFRMDFSISDVPAVANVVCESLRARQHSVIFCEHKQLRNSRKQFPLEILQANILNRSQIWPAFQNFVGPLKNLKYGLII